MIAPVPLPDDRAGADFLGSEFLTWLWWRAAVEPRFAHPDGVEVWLHLDEHIELRGERSAARRVALRAGMPGASMEARAALRSGKTVHAARFLLARGDEEMHFTLRGEDLDVSGLRLPSPEGETADERLEASLEALDRFQDDLDLCFSTFLAVRSSPAWPAEVDALRAWAAGPSEEEGLGEVAEREGVSATS
jgi:hypothetical protein